MSFYILYHAVDTKETGPTYPQLEFKNPKKFPINPVLEINKLFGGMAPPKGLIFDYLEVKSKKVKLTDILSSDFSTLHGFVVSDKLLEIFNNSNINTHEVFELIIKKQEEIIKGYSYFHLISDMKDMVNYGKSIFVYTEFDVEMPIDIPIHSYADLKSFFLRKVRLERGRELKFKKIVLKKKFPSRLRYV
jgi:hypothetical protein